MDPLTCPYCGLAPAEDPDELLEADGAELVLSAPAFSLCDYCDEVAVAMPPEGTLRPATDIERAAYHRAERRGLVRIRRVREGHIDRHFARRLGAPANSQRRGRHAP